MTVWRTLREPALEDPPLAGEEHWAARKVHGYLKAQIGEEVGYTTIVCYWSSPEKVDTKKCSV